MWGGLFLKLYFSMSYNCVVFNYLVVGGAICVGRVSLILG